MTRRRIPPFTIAHILPWPSVGGTEHATLRIARAVDPGEFRHLAFCPPDGTEVNALFAQFAIPTATYRPIYPGYRKPWPFLAASRQLAFDLRRHHVDMVHCADLLAGYYGACAGRMAGLPVLCHIRNRFEVIPQRAFLWPIGKFAFVSQHTRRHFPLPVRPSRSALIYDGIDIPPPIDAWDRLDVRREFSIPDSAPVIAMMARVAPQKDYPTLAKAAQRILRVEPETRFLIAGDYQNTQAHRDHYREIVALLDALGVRKSFVFTGYRQDIARLLAAADAFVLSTHHEGLPLVILEAMAMSKPVVATAVDGIPEIVHEGESGFLYPHQNDEQLADRLLALIRDPLLAARMGDRARRLVETQFTTLKFGQSMNALYREMLGVASP